MIDVNIIKQSKAFTLIELMVVTAIIAMLAAIAIPNYISFRNKAYCSEAESNANQIAGGIADYYSMPMRTALPTIDDLKISVANQVDIMGAPNTTISILVTDRSSRCPEDYQIGHERWLNDIFTKYIR